MTGDISARNLSYRLQGRALVDAVSLTLTPGSLTVVIGPNGAGKSTLLRLLTGEIAPSEGKVLYSGTPLSDLPPWRLAARRMVMTQSGAPVFPFRVHEVARLGLDSFRHVLSDAQSDTIVADSLAAVDVLHLADRVFPALSGGEQQRVRFARALCQLRAARQIEPAQALFLDEPIASLDIAHQMALMDVATAIAREGVTVFAVLHDLNMAVSYADELIVLSGGRIAAQGAPADVLTDAILERVFGLKLPVGSTAEHVPYVLPQLRREVITPV